MIEKKEAMNYQDQFFRFFKQFKHGHKYFITPIKPVKHGYNYFITPIKRVKHGYN